MKRSLLLCCACATLMALLPAANSQADDLQLTLDLLNANPADAASGGKWSLFARVVPSGSGASGASGIAGFRALIDNINVTGTNTGDVTFASGLNANAAADFGLTTDGTAEIVYGQDVGLSGLVNVGNNSPATKDTLIASGAWAPGAARPSFGDDDNGTTTLLSDGGFLDGVGNDATLPGSVLTSVVTIGDLNGNNIVSGSDTGQYIFQLTAPPASYNPAADTNQNGAVTGSDTGLYVAILGGTYNGAPLSANATSVPEPTAAVLLMLAGAGLFGFRRVI